MVRGLERKLLGYGAVVSAVALFSSRAAQGMLVTNSFTGTVGAGGELVDESGNTFLSMGNDAISNANGTSDPGIHLYVTNNKDKDMRKLCLYGRIRHWALANLPVGAVLGPSTPLPAGTAYENNLDGSDNDIAYIDTATGMEYANNPSNTPTQFPLNTPGYFGFSFTPGSTLDYGYAEIDFNAAGVESVTYTYDDSGAAVTVGQTAPVPEPTALSLLALGASVLLRRKRLA